MRRSLLLSIALVLCSLPATASGASHSSADATGDESSLAVPLLAPVHLTQEASRHSRLRTLARGRVQVGFTVGMQTFQVSFAILARVLAVALDQWAVGDSMLLEGLISLGSIPFVPLGVVGFKNLALDPRRGVAEGLLEGGIYSLSYAGLHLLFSLIASFSPSGGQGGDIGFLFVGIPIIVSHVATGLGMAIAGAVLLARSGRGKAPSGAHLERGDAPVAARRAAAPLLFPMPTFQRGGAGLALVAVF